MISPSYDELHDRVAEDAKLLELMELLRACRTLCNESVIEIVLAWIQHNRCHGCDAGPGMCEKCYERIDEAVDRLESNRADLVKRIGEVL